MDREILKELYDKDGAAQPWVKAMLRTAHNHDFEKYSHIVTYAQCIFCHTQLSIMGDGNITYRHDEGWGVCHSCHEKKVIETEYTWGSPKCEMLKKATASEASAYIHVNNIQHGSVCQCPCSYCEKEEHERVDCWCPENDTFGLAENKQHKEWTIQHAKIFKDMKVAFDNLFESISGKDKETTEATVEKAAEATVEKATQEISFEKVHCFMCDDAVYHLLPCYKHGWCQFHLPEYGSIEKICQMCDDVKNS